MASLEELRAERLKKLQEIEAAGMVAYPVSTKRTKTLAQVKADFAPGGLETLVGRVRRLRSQGAIIFCDLDDGTGRFQIIFHNSAKNFKLFSQTVDLGDFVEVTGQLIKSKTDQPSLEVSDWQMLTKSLRPLPDEWAGLKDTEERFRRRYLDSLSDEVVRTRFLTRAKLITALRSYLNENNYTEVETPVLQPLPGGATAKPFVTHLEALDLDLYLRVAPELYLKQMLVGGFNKVYEIGRNFRNEGVDVTHNPEFTMLEFYEAYSDAKKQITLVEDLIKTVVKEATGESKISYHGRYFVLGGLVPLAGPDRGRVRLDEFKTTVADRLATGLKEVIIALAASPEGDETSKLLIESLPAKVRDALIISQLGRGLSTGSELEYADEETLRQALNSRR